MGDHAGIGRADTGWSSDDAARVTEYISSGLRQFYYLSVVDGLPYEWSFLKPQRDVVLASGGRARLLPPDFGYLEGPVTVTASSDAYYRPVTVVNPARLDEMYAGRSTTTGAPQMLAIRPAKEADPDWGQRYEIFCYPEADREFTFRLTYAVHPVALSEAAPYHLGGPAHAETIIESCLSIMEQRLHDEMRVHTAKYQERLAASINFDRKVKPRSLGYNGDLSDMIHGGGTLLRREGTRLSFYMNGTQLF